MIHEIGLPFKKPPLSMNDRMHHMQRHRITQELRLVGRVKARTLPDMERCRITLVWYVNTKHRRDTINLMATLKPLVDGIVDAEVVADDDYTRVDTNVQIVYRPKSEGLACMVLRVEEIEKEGNE